MVCIEGLLMNGTDKWVIETHGLSKSYKGVEALKSLELKVPKNSIFGFLGPNGAGKTTTIKLLLGLIRPTEGRGTVFGHDIAHDSLRVRRRIGYLAQNPVFYEHMTARETLRFRARFFYGGPKYAIEDRVAETLDLMGLTDRADRPIGTFSGGELQRLGIAQAQVNHPDLLILDEPAANLDAAGRRDVLELMELLREDTTVFYCTHILDDVQRVGDTVAILNHGQLVAQGSLEDLLAGSEGTVYSLVVEGDPGHVQAQVAGQPWVSGIRSIRGDGRTEWQIIVTDDKAAKARLLRLVLQDRELNVIEFARKRYDLQEVFLSIVEEGRDAHQ